MAYLHNVHEAGAFAPIDMRVPEPWIFRNRVSDCIDHMLTTSRDVIRFDDLVEGANGVFPVDLLKVLELNPRFSSVVRHSETPHAPTIEQPTTSLPPENLLAYDWRFTSASSDVIVRHIEELVFDGRPRICCLGTPSVALRAAVMHPDWSITLMDFSVPLLRSVRQAPGGSDIELRLIDVRDSTTEARSGEFDLVVMDPPWYADYYYRFLSVALRLRRTGMSPILTVVFPELARESAFQDRSALFETIDGLGGAIDLLDEVRYYTPAFEQEVLRMSGIFDLRHDWRKAGLYLLRFPIAACLSPQAWVQAESDRWRLVSSGTTTIAFRRTSHSSAARKHATKSGFIGRETLATVSRSGIASRTDIVAVDHLNRVLTMQDVGNPCR